MTNTKSDPVIECHDYSFRFGKNAPAISDISLQIHEQENTALIGLNGSGKSTLLKSLVGILRGSGEIRVLGMEVKKSNFKSIRRRVGMVFQDPQVQLFCPTVMEDVAFGPINYHGDESRAVHEATAALEAVGYTGDYYAPSHNLSLGEMRKVALAGVLVLEPDILLLDEPDSYLDWDGKARLIEILQSLTGITRILATHDLDFARELCTKGLYLKEGRVDFHGELNTLVAKIVG